MHDSYTMFKGVCEQKGFISLIFAMLKLNVDKQLLVCPETY
jgi:hypothetical protein